MKKAVLSVLLVGLGATAVAGCGTQSISNSGGTSQSKPTIIVGSKSFTENILVGDMMYDLLKQGLPNAAIQNKQNLGGTMVPWNALQSGQLSMYTEYTGTGLIDILKQPVSHDANYTYNYVSQQYPQKFKIDWMKPLGFNDTYAIAVPKAFAEKYNLKTISDLAKVENQVTFGAEPEFFSRPDGYAGLTKAYGLKFVSTKEINVGLKYEAVKKGDVQAIDVFSTDGQLIKYNMVVLKDDKNFYPPYYAAPIVREDIIKAYPQIPDILNQLAGKITNKQMQQMNYDVDVKHESADTVAKKFLQQAGLLK
ncbi:glycine/betaine ABC transporter substrate-binding protein [Fodinisporobacter ferrooxydans]|uniref:Glycine/betaine ABC transporter substrate-binding protein n=1 Tax=Fodinisporobacter ferrooxydans TaxID=2901836 RepID=A0ABY4CLS4_9BACL|nr:glycine/betaine ABC transporter substrate-binding protein [Alicyclobacillaceae bacterium MYW30-H2]